MTGAVAAACTECREGPRGPQRVEGVQHVWLMGLSETLDGWYLNLTHKGAEVVNGTEQEVPSGGRSSM